MTLNIVLATAQAVHVGADFRLTNADSGKIITDRSPKVLVLKEDGWEGVVTYNGVGMWQSRNTSDWIRDWVQHNPSVTRSFEETASVLEREGNRWLAGIRRGGQLQRPALIHSGRLGEWIIKDCHGFQL